MLHHTFIHLPGITPAKERSLWRQGIFTWADFEQTRVPQRSLFPPWPGGHDRRESQREALEASYKAFEDGDADFFATRLPKNEHFRIALAFPSKTTFLDIETTGLSLYYDHITIVGVSVGGTYTCHKGINGGESLEDILSEAKCLVTFNGTIFDTKFVRNEYNGIRLPEAHVDLRFLARRVGLTDGQKVIERVIGARREEDVEGLAGEKAPLLWHEYRLGSVEAGRRLVRYNHADIEGMKLILDAVLDRMWTRDGGLANFGRFRFADCVRPLKWARTPATAKKNQIYVPPFGGKKGPQITYRRLILDRRWKGFRIVGIDLTGSERRPSGWCLLVGNRAKTEMPATDEEIIGRTVDVRPDVVSIDSPLSLPRGRTRVGDDDPKRDVGGIMRECERELKRRGVNVYPSLIPSMQSLTARGIDLATRFRKLGIPVIESYPGAAQDIIGIPRKRSSLEYLTKGLAEFGLRGAFQNDKLTHDELDAITAALVGLFFWAGKFEPLGNENEDYLIIPDLHRSPDDWMSRRVIGLSGEIAAGKTTAAKWLEHQGFTCGRFGQVLTEMLEIRGKAADRDSLQKFGENVHRRPGQRWLCQQLIGRFPDGQDIVVDGLRWREDHSFFVERFGPAFRHLHIDAPENVRRQRYAKMGHPPEEFDRAIKHEAETETTVLGEHAAVCITNASTKEAFNGRIAEVITKQYA